MGLLDKLKGKKPLTEQQKWIQYQSYAAYPGAVEAFGKKQAFKDILSPVREENLRRLSQEALDEMEATLQEILESQEELHREGKLQTPVWARKHLVVEKDGSPGKGYWSPNAYKPGDPT